MSALELSTNLGDTKSSVSVLHASVPVTSVIAAGCDIAHTPYHSCAFITSECIDNMGTGEMRTEQATILQDKEMHCFDPLRGNVEVLAVC